MTSNMTPEQHYFARTMFRNRVLEADGQRYQDLFVRVMTKRNKEFRPIKPQGREGGDEGNDGYVPNMGRYYQVYAPEKPDTKIADAVRKAESDFWRIKEKWERTAPVQEYYFVFNDKYKGAYPKIEHALARMKQENNLKVSEPFLAKDLEREFFELSEDDMMDVLGCVIPRSEHIEDIDYPIFTVILQHILDNYERSPISDSLVLPDYEEKIRFNRISKGVESLFNHGSYQRKVIEQYFERNGKFSRFDVRDRLVTVYQESKEQISGYALDEGGDHIFFKMLNTIVQDGKRSVQDAAIALIAFFFETCDVFEEPVDG